jgi:hypothetical protein
VRPLGVRQIAGKELNGRVKDYSWGPSLRNEAAVASVKASDGSRCHLAQEGLEFAVRHLDGLADCVGAAAATLMPLIDPRPCVRGRAHPCRPHLIKGTTVPVEASDQEDVALDGLDGIGHPRIGRSPPNQRLTGNHHRFIRLNKFWIGPLKKTLHPSQLSCKLRLAMVATKTN